MLPNQSNIKVSQGNFEFPTPYLQLDADSNIRCINTEARKLLDLYGAKRPPMNMVSIVEKDQYQRFMDMVHIVMERGKIDNFIFTHCSTKDKIWFHADEHKDGQGNVLGVHGTLYKLGEGYGDPALMNPDDMPSIMDCFPYGMVTVKVDGSIDMNRTLIEQTRCSEHELCFDKVPMWLEQLKLHGSTSENRMYDRIQGNDGTYREFRITHLNGIGKGDESIDFLIIIQVTEAEKELRKEQKIIKTLAALLYTFPKGIILEDGNGKVVYVNEGFTKMFLLQTKAKELSGLDFDSLLNLACLDHTNIEDLLRLCDLIRAKNLQNVTEIFKCRDGRSIILEYSRAIYANESINIWSFREHSPSLVTNKVNGVNRNRYAGLIANAGLGLMEVDGNGHILMINHQVTKLTGYQKSDLLGKKVRKVLGWKDSNLVNGFKGFGENKIIQQREVNVVKKNGNHSTWQLSSAPRLFENETVSGYFVLLQDVSEVKTLRQRNERITAKLEEQTRCFQEYDHVLSHDFKTPLRTIHSLITWFKEDYGKTLGKDGRTTLDLIQETVERMDKLVEDTLNYIEIEHQKKTEKPVDIHSMVQDVRSKMDIPSHINIAIKNHLPMVTANSDLIIQLFENLISNAVNGIDKEKGLITITCEELKDAWKFSIKDNGMGIPKEYHDKIFSVFQSLKGSGTGLGLSVVKKIVKKYKGKIWLESELNRGSTFHFTLAKAME